MLVRRCNSTRRLRTVRNCCSGHNLSPFLQAALVWILLATWCITPELGGTRRIKYLSERHQAAALEQFLRDDQMRKNASEAWLRQRQGDDLVTSGTAAARSATAAAAAAATAKAMSLSALPDPGAGREALPLYAAALGGDDVAVVGGVPLLSICVGITAVAGRAGAPVVDTVHSLFRDAGSYAGRVVAVLQEAGVSKDKHPEQAAGSYQQLVNATGERWARVGGVEALQRAVPGLQVLPVKACIPGSALCSSDAIHSLHYATLLERCVRACMRCVREVK